MVGTCFVPHPVQAFSQCSSIHWLVTHSDSSSSENVCANKVHRASEFSPKWLALVQESTKTFKICIFESQPTDFEGKNNHSREAIDVY